MTTTTGVCKNFFGLFVRVEVYGFAGDDYILVKAGVSCPAKLYGGDGSDQLFANNYANNMLDGGAGDDLLESVGGNASTLTGGGGVDSYWRNNLDMITDLETAESLDRTDHAISAFSNPGASLKIEGQNFSDPALTSNACAYTNFGSIPLFSGGPEFNDIAQGSLGDCYFMASLASFAKPSGSTIQQAIAPLGDGTFAVRFYSGSTPKYLRIDADLPIKSSGSLAYAGTGVDKELWAALLEKAYAYFRSGKNSYGSLEGGTPSDVYSHLTGSGATTLNIGTTTDDALYNFLNTNLSGGHAVTLGSNSSSPFPICHDHAYSLYSVENSGGTKYATVYNPWGKDGYTWDSNPSDGLLKITISQLKNCFKEVFASLAEI